MRFWVLFSQNPVIQVWTTSSVLYWKLMGRKSWITSTSGKGMLPTFSVRVSSSRFGFELWVVYSGKPSPREEFVQKEAETSFNWPSSLSFHFDSFQFKNREDEPHLIGMCLRLKLLLSHKLSQLPQSNCERKECCSISIEVQSRDERKSNFTVASISPFAFSRLPRFRKFVTLLRTISQSKFCVFPNQCVP